MQPCSPYFCLLLSNKHELAIYFIIYVIIIIVIITVNITWTLSELNTNPFLIIMN